MHKSVNEVSQHLIKISKCSKMHKQVHSKYCNNATDAAKATAIILLSVNVLNDLCERSKQMFLPQFLLCSFVTNCSIMYYIYLLLPRIYIVLNMLHMYNDKYSVIN